MSTELPPAKVSGGETSSVSVNKEASSTVTEVTNVSSTTMLAHNRNTSKYEHLKSLSDIRTTRDLTDDGIRDILRRHTRDHGLEMISTGKLEDMSGLNDAFNSSICSLDVRAKYRKSPDKDQTEEDFHFVIKSPPQSSFIKMLHKFTRPFYNEVAWYMDLVSILELANGKGCLESILPKCYHAYSTYYMEEAQRGDRTPCCEANFPWWCYMPCKKAEEGILILENIKFREAKYQMYDKAVPLNLGHVQLVMRALANFHGMWLRYKFKAQAGQLNDGDEDNSVVAMSWEAFEKRHNTQKRMPKLVYQQLKKVAKRTVLRILAKCGAEEDENAGKCRRFFNHTAKRMLNECLTMEPTPVYTLCHGDFWSNNILFSYKEEDLVAAEQPPATPQDLIIIDYQLINVGHPCYDLVYFLYLNTDLAFRDAHLQDILRLYYDTFANYFDDNLKYTYEQFMKDYNWYRAIGFTTACSVMPNVLSDNKVDLEGNAITAFAELQRKQEEDMEDDNNLRGREIRRRIVDLVHEMARDELI